MKPSDFEANFTAWLDGQLEAEQAAAFEQELRAQGFDPAAERAAAAQTGDLLRQHSTAPAMKNADFFQHQLLHRIQQESERPPAATRSWWSFPRLMWAGAFCLLMAGVLFKTMIPVGSKPTGNDYFATIVDARTYEPTISVDTVYDPRDNVTVLWLDGLDYMPTDIVQ